MSNMGYMPDTNMIKFSKFFHVLRDHWKDIPYTQISVRQRASDMGTSRKNEESEK